MAKTQKDLKGWQYFLTLDEDVLQNEVIEVKSDEEPKTPSRKTRRSRVSTPQKNLNPKSNLKLTRESDNLNLQVGDVILVDEKGSDIPGIAIIKEIQFGVLNFIDIVVTWFIRMDNVEFNDLPKVSEYSDSGKLLKNEIFATSYQDDIFLKQVIDKAVIVTNQELEKDLIIDNSNEDSTFMCRRGCDQWAEIFTEEFDFREWHDSFKTDPTQALKLINSQTIPKAYKEPKASPQKKVKQEPSTPSKKRISKTMTPSKVQIELQKAKEENDHDSGDGDEKSPGVQDDSDEDAELDEEDSDEEDSEAGDSDLDETDDDEFGSNLKGKKRTKKTQKQKTPAKRKRQAKPLTSTNNSPVKIPKIGKRRVVVKPDVSKLNLPTLSPRKPKQVAKTLLVDPSSESFKQVRARLHASTRLAELPCRTDEFTAIYVNLENAISEGTGCCVYISGTPGVGKTATIREVIEQLNDAKKEDITGNFDFDFLEINGLKLLTPSVAYEKLYEKISGLKVSASNAALLLEEHFKNEEEERKPLVVLMDELDQIVTARQNVMYNFFNWPTYANSKLIVIAVANTMDLPERVLSNKISSRLGLRRIQFVPYNVDELAIIIRNRLVHFTKQSRKRVVFDEPAIEFASKKVGIIVGDVRKALMVCRRAVEMVEQAYVKFKQEDSESNNGAKFELEDKELEEQSLENNLLKIENGKIVVRMRDIARAFNESNNSPARIFIRTLPFASKLVLASLLLRMKRSGLADNSLGDIIDEMKNSLAMLTSKESSELLSKADSKASLMTVLYGNFYNLSNGLQKNKIRIANFRHIVTELVENGILIEQNVRSERHRLVSLNVTRTEVASVLKEDTIVKEIVKSLDQE
ncbi:hypothetical protein HYPBUDRAFT_164109 [Hyphopichia burtonii NRRL Y-1933]|uniref:Origin recognition complex subunit 1 n=1 Tax=Hyphopichia burtonii NRRL Y-1933 TaxID=984485 RepID=A0A1E4RQC2_9ASCO|nr:hypothetical protein HYPBUDRAFT_164109 [Hyphopichia burtonii NRRL Y-1933]ODV69483.1 hypothetical protein HYPBUDRAFT_164109 [Hyphopichia burtonii NRRL Y-1933]